MLGSCDRLYQVLLFLLVCFPVEVRPVGTMLGPLQIFETEPGCPVGWGGVGLGHYSSLWFVIGGRLGDALHAHRLLTLVSHTPKIAPSSD